MLLTVVKNYVYASAYSADEYKWLDEVTTYGCERFSPREKRVVTHAMHFTLGKKPRFPVGLLRLVIAQAEVDDVRLDVKLVKPVDILDRTANIDWLDDIQRKAFNRAVSKRNGILKLSTGAGKCLGVGTLVLKYDGTIVPVESIVAGDVLMGPDSQPRTVLRTNVGTGQLYRIVPVKGDSWVCNDVHVMTLVNSRTSEVSDTPLNVYMYEKNKDFRRLHKLFQPEMVKFEDTDERKANRTVDPYFLGVWYGDGRKNLKQGIQISKPDKEIEDLCQETATLWGLQLRVDNYASCPTYRIVNGKLGGNECNALTDAMRKIVGDGTGLPLEYMCGPIKVRKQFLAGLLDTDGHLCNGGFEIVQRNKGFADGVAFIARSLGLRVTTAVKVVNSVDYYRLSISGNTDKIPTRLARKQAEPRQQIKNALRTGFSVVDVGIGDYYGFTLDGDGRFLLGDFTVTHNTEIATALMHAHKRPWLFLVHRKTLCTQTADRYFLRTGERAGLIVDGTFAPGRVTIATYQTITAMLLGSRRKETTAYLESIYGVIADECHVVPSSTAYSIVMACKNTEFSIGLSATPLARSDQRSIYAIAALGPIIFKVSTQESIKTGRIVPLVVKMLVCVHPANKGNWQYINRRFVVEGDDRNRLLAQAAKMAKKPCFVFVKQIDQGNALVKLIRKHGVNADFVNGSHKAEQRIKYVKKLVRRDIDVIVTTPVFQEGIDIPSLSAVVYGGGGASVIAVLQSVGRASRADSADDTKTSAEVWDILDVGIASLNKHSEARIKAYRGEGHAVSVGSFERGFAPRK